MDIKLNYGPWETVFVGLAYRHEVEIVTNPDHFYLVLIYDKKDSKKVGAIVQGYKAFYAKGQMETFIQTLPKSCFGIEKNISGKSSKIFFLSFEPFYSDFKLDDYERKIDSSIKTLEENSTTLVDLARTAAVDLKELSIVPKNDYSIVLGDPFTLMAIFSGKKDTQLSKIDVKYQSELVDDVSPLIQLGLSKTREIMKELSTNLYRTQIIGKCPELLYLSYIITENLLLENYPILIFDDDDYFSQLGVISTHSTELREELVDFEPMAFPIKPMLPKESVYISLKDVDLFFVLEMLGLKDVEFQKNLSLFSFASQVDTSHELIRAVLDTKEMTDYEKLRAERMIMIIDKTFPRLFGEATPTDELIKTIPGRLGRAVIFDTKNLSPEEKVIFTHAIFRQITKSASESKKINCVLVAPKFDDLLKQNEQRANTIISRLESRGIGFVIGSSKEMPDPITQITTVKASIISGKDVAISVKGKRSYRVILRPTLSGDPKI